MLNIEGVSIRFGPPGAPEAVTDVSFSVKEKEKVVMIGETGSGKSVLLLAILRMLPPNAAVSGKACWNGVDLLTLSQKKMERIRGRDIAYVPQGSGNGMNPLHRIGHQVGEPLVIHQKQTKRKAFEAAVEVMKRFDFENVEKLARRYPHSFSGGMRQRAMIAMGMIEGASILFADEPTKGLDARRIQLVEEAFQRMENRALLCVTHDLRFAGRIGERIIVMYASQQVEMGSKEDIFQSPLHPYTVAMLHALPENGLQVSAGFAPPREDDEMANACRFYQRCPDRTERCRKNPPLFSLSGDRKVRCWKYAD